MRIFLALLFLSIWSNELIGQEKFLSIDCSEIKQQREQLNNDNLLKDSYVDLLKRADEQLKKGPYSVTYKTIIPPSGDIHDYMSIGPYWWPDPTKSDGLPYIQRDGVVNPDRNKITDQSNLSQLESAVRILGLAYYYSNDEKYAKYASKLIAVFFIDSKTKMNPNLLFGQGIPGRNHGRGIGLIETSGINSVMEGVLLISDSKSWTKELDAGFKIWVDDFLNWTLTHQYGIDERNTNNNHGTHYDAQVVGMMIFTGKITQAQEYIQQYTMPRLQAQIEKDGAQPHELSRTKSFNYTVMNARGFLRLASMSEGIGVDLWNYSNDGQVYIKSMMDWFVPYLKHEKKWQYKQIVNFNLTTLIPMLTLVGEIYNDSAYYDLISNLKSVNEMIVMPLDYNISENNALIYK